ncbi:hypothetical protein ABK040_012659 [Willaertia magna]
MSGFNSQQFHFEGYNQGFINNNPYTDIHEMISVMQNNLRVLMNEVERRELRSNYNNGRNYYTNNIHRNKRNRFYSNYETTTPQHSVNSSQNFDQNFNDDYNNQFNTSNDDYNNYNEYYNDYMNNYQDNYFRQSNYKKKKYNNYYNNDIYYNNDNYYNINYNNDINYQFNFSNDQIEDKLINNKNKLIGNIIPNNYNRKSIYVRNNRYNGQDRLHVECSLLCKRIRSFRSFEKKVENAAVEKTTNEKTRNALYNQIIDKLDLERNERDLFADRMVDPYEAYQAGFRTWRPKKIFQFDGYTLEGQYDARDLDFYDVQGLAGLQLVEKNDKVMFFSQNVLGLFIPIKNVDSEIVGAQLLKPNNDSNPQYLILSSKRSHGVTIHNCHQEIPLAFWECNKPAVTDALFVVEGILKSYITSLRTKSHCLGGTCSDFLASETTLHYYLQEFKKKYPYVDKAFICPDAGMLTNEMVTANYIELSIVLEHYFTEVYFLWWGQLERKDGNIDELDDYQLFNWCYLTREEYVCKHNKEMIQYSKFLKFYRDELKRKRMYSTILQRCYRSLVYNENNGGNDNYENNVGYVNYENENADY